MRLRRPAVVAQRTEQRTRAGLACRRRIAVTLADEVVETGYRVTRVELVETQVVIQRWCAVVIVREQRTLQFEGPAGDAEAGGKVAKRPAEDLSAVLCGVE